MRRPQPPHSKTRRRTVRRRTRRLSTVNCWRVVVFAIFLAVFIVASEMPR